MVIMKCRRRMILMKLESKALVKSNHFVHDISSELVEPFSLIDVSISFSSSFQFLLILIP